LGIGGPLGFGGPFGIDGGPFGFGGRRFKELITYRGSRAWMMAQVPLVMPPSVMALLLMALAGLAGFSVPLAVGLRRVAELRAAELWTAELQRVVGELRRVASFGFLWRRLSRQRLDACGTSRPSAPPLDVSVPQQPFWLRRGVCGLGRLSRQQPHALQRSVCGSL